MNGMIAPIAHLLFFCLVSLLYADDSSDVTILERVEFIRAIDNQSPDENLKRLIDLTKDNTRVPQRVLVPEPLTISSLAGDKLGAVRGNEVVQRLALEAIEESISEEQFGILLRAINFGLLSDQAAAKLQELCIHKGDAFVAELLSELAASPNQIDEKFDLLITRGLKSETCVSFACQAILNRQGRNLLWNARLVALCKSSIMGSVNTAPDLFIPIDIRCFVLHALRKNGFPSSDVVSFLKSFSPPKDTELYWQHVATKYTVLNDSDAFSSLVDALGNNDSRGHAAKVLAQNVYIPSEARTRILDFASTADDLASSRIGSVIISQFMPSDFTEKDLVKLESLFARSEHGLKRFKSWVNEE